MSAEKKIKFKSIAIKLCALGLTIVVAGLAYLCLTPKKFQAVAKVEILKSAWNSAGNAKSSFGPEKLPGECQAIRSDVILDRVITNLNLSVLWAQRSGQGVPLKTESAREQLRELLDVHPALNSSVIEIAAAGSDPLELARIANETARLYCAFRQTGREGASQQGINSLRAAWEAQNKKVQQAQSALDQLSHDYNLDRATNAVQVYDAEALQSLRTRRSALQNEYDEKANRLARLKSLDREQLLTFFSTNSAETNAVLTNALQQLARAKNDLAAAKTAHGPDASETRGAKLVVEQLNRRVNGMVTAAMSMRELDLTSLKATLDQLNYMAEKAAHSAEDEGRMKDQVKTQDANYARTKENRDRLVRERDALEREINGSGTMTAAMPDVITARVVDLADPPVKPVSPDKKIVLAAFSAGGVLAGAGLLLLIVLNLKPGGAKKNAA